MDSLINFDVHSFAYFGLGFYFLKISLPWLLKATKVYWDSVRIPGPVCLPYIGSVSFIFDVLTRTVSMKSVESYLKKYKGFFRITIGSKLFLVVSNSSDIEELVGSKNVSSKSPFFSEMITEFIGNSFITESSFNDNVATNKLNESILNSFIHIQNIAPIQNILPKNCNILIKNMQNLCDKNLVDISPIIDRCIADILSETIFGTEASFHKGSQDIVIKSCERLPQAIFDRRSRFWLHNDHLYSQTHRRKVKLELMEHITQFVTKMIEKRTNHFNGDVIENSFCLADVLLKYCDHFRQGSITVIKESTFLWNTGMLMLCDTLKFMLIMLAMDKKSQDKSIEEIKRFHIANMDDSINHENVKYLPFLRSCLKEVLRLFPQFPIVSKCAISEIKMNSRNVTIPSEAEILIANFVANRNADTWNMPDSFIPERFYKSEKYSNNPARVFHPFSIFSEKHLDEDLGEQIILTMVMHLLTEYEFNSDWKIDNLPLTKQTITKCNWGYKISVKKRY